MDPDEIAALADEVEETNIIYQPTRKQIVAALREFERDKREWLTIPRM